MSDKTGRFPFDCSIPETLRNIANGRFSVQEWVGGCLDRIALYDSAIHAWVLVDETGAKRFAAELTQKRADGRPLRPLHGVPIGVKDIIDVEGMTTRAGFKPWITNVAANDATIVSRLRAADAIMLGKTVTTQLACFDPAETCNPWNMRHTPGGSSSGSAAAVASGMCAAALGTQTGGSIIRPATYCGVAGLKPTFQSLSLERVVLVSPHLDHVGPIARRIEDLAYVWHVLDASGDQPTFEQAYAEFTSWFVDSDLAVDLVLISDFWDSPDLDAEQRDLLVDLLKQVEGGTRSGEIRIQRDSMPIPIDEIREEHWTIMAFDAAEVHKQTFDLHPDAFLPNIRSMLEEGRGIRASDFDRALEHQREFRSLMTEKLQPAKIALIPATNTPAPATLDSTGSPLFNAPWSYSGFPELSLPVALTKLGLPVGLQLIGLPGSERMLLNVAHGLERVIGFDNVPTMTR